MGRVALVLSGGAARGAFEVGVVGHILEEVARDLGRPPPLDILCGTSVGAINACFLAARADEPITRVRALIDHWQSLRLGDMVRLSPRGLRDAAAGLIGRASRNPERSGGILDVSGIERVVREQIPFHRIEEHLAQGRLHALTVSTTHVGSGRTVVFVASAEPELPPWSSDLTVIPRRARIGADHALASAALPFLFPAVRIEGHFHCDGGLRQNVPLSPARRLGADRLIVVHPRHLASLPDLDEAGRDAAFPGPLFLLGKTLNALLLDRVESDLDRLDRINQILLAGCRRYGPRFLDEINEEMGKPAGKASLRPLETVLIRSSTDIGRLAAEFVRSPEFTRRAPPLLGRVLLRMAEGEPRSEADFLSYLLFDGEFARLLIERGRADARARHDDLCRFFADA